VHGGDGETASGAEVSGDVRRSWGRWEAGLQGRRYAADTADASFDEQGVGAAIGMRARPDGTGLAFTLSPGWGTQASGAAGLLAAMPARQQDRTSSGVEILRRALR